jgi:secreted trypsin-like serine protease
LTKIPFLLGPFGGGAVMKVNNLYTLFGVVSTGMVWDGVCDLTEYIIFTDVRKYYDWIVEAMIETI